LISKSFQGRHFPALEHDLFAWVRQCELKKGLSNDEMAMVPPRKKNSDPASAVVSHVSLRSTSADVANANED
jgi:hypothetical protein